MLEQWHSFRAQFIEILFKKVDKRLKVIEALKIHRTVHVFKFCQYNAVGIQRGSETIRELWHWAAERRSARGWCPTALLVDYIFPYHLDAETTAHDSYQPICNLSSDVVELRFQKPFHISLCLNLVGCSDVDFCVT